MEGRRGSSRTWRAARAARATFRSKITPPVGRAPYSAPRGPRRWTCADSTLIRPFSTRKRGPSYIRADFVFRAQFRGPDHRRPPGLRTERGRRRLGVILGPGGGWGRGPSLARTRRRLRRRQNHRSPNLQGRGLLVLVRQVGRRHPADFCGRRDGRASTTYWRHPAACSETSRRTRSRFSVVWPDRPTRRHRAWRHESVAHGRTRRRRGRLAGPSGQTTH